MINLSLNKKRIRAVLSGVALATLMTVAAGAAHADDRDWRWHEQHARRWHRVHPHPVAVAPVIYSPPVVYYPPPPPEPGINLILPLNFH